jgi:hypothetical protein
MGTSDRRDKQGDADAPAQAPLRPGARPISELPAVYWQTLKALLVCKDYDDYMGWSLVVWDNGIRAWFLGNEGEFEWWVEEGFKQTPVDDRESMYLHEPTHFAELPDLPERQGLH